MSLFKLKTVPTLLIEDDCNKNILPIVTELIDNTDCILKIFCYEQPVHCWQSIFKDKSVQCFKGFQKEDCTRITDKSKKVICIIDSVNQMALEMSWDECLRNIKNLQNDCSIIKLIIVLHTDCIPNASKLRVNLNHMANGIITYDSKNCYKVSIQIKKNGKFFKSEEMISYDRMASTLKLTPIVKADKKVEEPEKISPGNLTTFKIEMDQTQQLEKHKLKLPYMSKIKEGQGKVYYEPDAVDDWDDEDPDDDLDI
ncbi:elongator complex protein 5 [Vanessa atalanta]|uniref:elongator complex protein 5 n=1 Tax=Vanessa atalanta TaxID=42275 RepID=UPI001FCDBF0B|nr:elongator complex protein 5 [Vanessa atalanta]